MPTKSSADFMAQLAALQSPMAPVARADLTVTRNPSGDLITVKGELLLSDARRLDINEAITVDKASDSVSHRLRYPPKTYARRIKFMDGASDLFRVEDEAIHGLHFHFKDSGKACCSRGRRVDLSDAPGGDVAEALTLFDILDVVDVCYYRSNEYFCKQFPKLGLVAKVDG